MITMMNTAYTANLSVFLAQVRVGVYRHADVTVAHQVLQGLRVTILRMLSQSAHL